MTQDQINARNAARYQWMPKPGSSESRAVELLRFLPKGTALCAAELRERAQIFDAGSLHIHLQQAMRHHLLRAVKRCDDGGRIRTYWMDGRGEALPRSRT